MTNLATFKELYAQELSIRIHALTPESAHYLSIQAVCRRLAIPCTPDSLHDYLTKGTISQQEGVIQ